MISYIVGLDSVALLVFIFLVTALPPDDGVPHFVHRQSVFFTHDLHTEVDDLDYGGVRRFFVFECHSPVGPEELQGRRAARFAEEPAPDFGDALIPLVREHAPLTSFKVVKASHI